MFKPDGFRCSGQKDLTLYENGTLTLNPGLKGTISHVIIREDHHAKNYWTTSDGFTVRK